MFGFSFLRPAAVPAAETVALVPLQNLVGVLARRQQGSEDFRMSVRALSERQCEAHTYEPVKVGEHLRIKVVTGSQALDVDAVVMNVSPAESGSRAWVALMGFVQPTAVQRQAFRSLLSRHGQLTA